MTRHALRRLAYALLAATALVPYAFPDPGRALLLEPRASPGPAPLCGIVLWGSNPRIEAYKGAVTLEFSYFYYSDVAGDDPAGDYAYDWSAVDAFLSAAKARGHHGIVRFRDTDPELGLGRPSLPASLWATTRQADYREGIAGAARTRVAFPDWSNPAVPAFIAAFYRKMAERYPDQSSGLAYVEVGFGFWGEYHIDFDNLSAFSDEDADTVEEAVGRLFPSRADQLAILGVVAEAFTDIPWGISIDAADPDFGPFGESPPGGPPAFGLFDDSLLHAEWEAVNEGDWGFFDHRTDSRVNGGEFSYYTRYDQRRALDADGPHGIPLAEAAGRRRLSFVIGDGQTKYRSPAELAAAGRLLGYALEVEDASPADGGTAVTVRNAGAAVVPFRLFAAFGAVRSSASLKGLMPGEARTLVVPVVDPDPADFAFVSPALLPGQVVPYTVRYGTAAR
ncbi:MAG: hypothetical protein CVV47_03530 [Spirochaetae bacterium HGW-Spirochaetae-3]|jgi:hypothetical protein|nr:MAG: hypothetical protein CVV47_03530 [Spirochaetae bacterium HGW-Spirochaetae-3]